MNFFGDFGLRDTFQERIAPKPIEIDIEKLRKKFSALNVDFNGQSLDVLGSSRASKSGASPVKVVILLLLPSQFVKTVAHRHEHATYHNKH